MRLAADRCPGTGARAWLSSRHKRSATTQATAAAHSLPAGRASTEIRCSTTLSSPAWRVSDRIFAATPRDRLSQHQAICNRHSVPHPRLVQSWPGQHGKVHMLAWLKEPGKLASDSTLPLWLDCDAGAKPRLLRALGRARHAGRPLRDDCPAPRSCACAALPGRARTAGRSAQAMTETFVVDLDDTLREMTVGDLAVPRQVKRAVAVAAGSLCAAMARRSTGPRMTVY